MGSLPRASVPTVVIEGPEFDCVGSQYAGGCITPLEGCIEADSRRKDKPVWLGGVILGHRKCCRCSET